ncbi:MAG: hypothetical protein WB999_02080, partial [Candidatus Binataceae bacterium]
ALMAACYETASRTMFDSEPESSKIRQVADKFFEIAKQYVGAVPKTGDRQVVVRAVNYMAHVHAFSLLKDDAAWFRYTLEVLIELAYPGEVRPPAADLCRASLAPAAEFRQRHLGRHVVERHFDR